MTETSVLLDALHKHYRKPGTPRDGIALMTEVQAPGSQRRADLVAIGLMASRGVQIDAHELKVSRADFQRELDDPGKAEAWWPFCDRWWIVSPSPGITPPELLPPGWGLMVPNARARRFRVIVPAAERQATISRSLLLELVKRTDNTRLAEIEALSNQHRDDLWNKVEAAKREVASRLGDVADPTVKPRIAALEALEKTLGARIDEFGYGRETLKADQVGRALADYVREHVALQDARETIRRAAKALGDGRDYAMRQAERAIADLDKAFPERVR